MCISPSFYFALIFFYDWIIKEPNLLCELLMEYGACASWITDADRYTEFEEPIFHEPPVASSNSHTIEQMLATPWIAPVWNQCNVTALFPASIHIPTTVAAIREIYSDIVALMVDDDLGVSDEEVAASDDQNADTSDNLANTKSSSSPPPSGFLESYDIETIPNNKDWVLSVQQSWHPIIINDCFILRFPWHTDDDVVTAIQKHYNGSRSANYNIVSSDQEDEQSTMTKGKALIPILLQGGIAFGTGEHATTQLCLQWLHDTVSQTLLSQPTRPQRSSTIRVLDYGTGSGILGIAACAMGQQEQHRRSMSTADETVDFDARPLVTAVGIDIDIDACRIANANAILNGNVAMKSYLPSLHNNANDDESQSLLMKAHYNYQQQQQPPPPNAISDQNNAATLDDIVLSDPSTVLCAESFDICVANILAGPLIVLAHTLYNYLQPGGMIGMSGILTHQGNMIVETYQNVGFINVRIHDNMNGWILVTGQRPFL